MLFRGNLKQFFPAVWFGNRVFDGGIVVIEFLLVDKNKRTPKGNCLSDRFFHCRANRWRRTCTCVKRKMYIVFSLDDTWMFRESKHYPPSPSPAHRSRVTLSAIRVSTPSSGQRTIFSRSNCFCQTLSKFIGAQFREKNWRTDSRECVNRLIEKN